MRLRTRALALAAVLLTGGCTTIGGAAPASAPAAHVATSRPGAALTVVADAHAEAESISASRLFFATSDVVVVAGSQDAAGELLGASAAVAMGVPLLMSPHGGGDTAAFDAEIQRLRATSLLVVGAARGDVRPSGGTADRARTGAATVVAVPADPRAVGEATGLRFPASRRIPADGGPAAVAGLDPTAPTALVAAGAPAPPAGKVHGSVPRVHRGAPLSSTVVLATGSPESLAGIATARAAGARVQLTDGETDPRHSAGAVTALSRDHPDAVVALGAGWAAQEGLDWKVRTAASGRQLPGGGQVLFPGRMLVALYGTPGTPALGVLGEQDLPASIQRARDHAAAFEPLVDVPVVPAFEIIATIASSAPGPDGNFSSESDPAALRPWVEAAGRAGLYVILDLQPGRADFLTQAKEYQSLLELPFVGLALDPEWRLGPTEVPLQQIGSVGVDEINRVVTWLADLTRAKALPQKLLVVHQFRLGMIGGRDRLDTSRDELGVVLHADGQGSQGNKQATWAALHAHLPAAPLHWGWKNFYDEDQPMLTPQQTVDQVVPRPDLVSYQ